MAFFFLKVSAGLAQISETSRLRDQDKTKTLAIQEPRPGLRDPRPPKMVLRPRPRPGLETTTLVTELRQEMTVFSSSNFDNKFHEVCNTISLVSLWFDLDKIATQGFFAESSYWNRPEQHIKNVEKSKFAKMYLFALNKSGHICPYVMGIFVHIQGI